jgi:hypothetical protein
MLLKHSTVPVIVSAMTWMLYVVNAAFHIDVLHLLSSPDRARSSPTEMLILAVIITGILLVIAIVQTRKAIDLARVGVEVEGTISRHGTFSYHGHLRVECSYTIGNAEHVFIWSTLRDMAPAVGEKVVLLVDPQNPKRCMLIENVFADRKREVKVAAKTLPRRIFEYAIYTFAAVGLAWMAWDHFHKARPNPAPAAAGAPAAVDPPVAAAPPPARPATKPPGRQVLFQPMFVWENSQPTLQGTGFFVKAPGGKVAAVTSIHFLDVAGPRLREVRWLNVADNKPAAVLDRSWGPRGEARAARLIVGKDRDGKPEIVTLPMPDKRTDYLLMPASQGVPADAVLELDPRTTIDAGERVYFHDKCRFGQKDYAVLEGSVVRATPEQYQVMLDQDIEPESQSGSPVISQATGEVIGTLAGIGDFGADAAQILLGGGRGSPRLLVLTPSCAILKALQENHDFPLLQDVIGKKAAGSSPARKEKTDK